MAPLTHLLKKEVVWQWSKAWQDAFDGVKHALTHALLLVLPDVTQPFEVVTHAFLVGIGAVLLNNVRPLAFESRKLSAAEINYFTGEQELLAMLSTP